MSKLEAKWTDRATLGGTLYSNIDCKWDIKILNACKKKQYFRGNSNTHLILDKLCTKNSNLFKVDSTCTKQK